jgi:P-type Cu2+ transporter
MSHDHHGGHAHAMPGAPTQQAPQPEIGPRHVADDGHAAHDKHAGHSVAMFRDRFWLSLVLTIPTLIWEPMIQEWFGYTAPQFPGSQFMPPLFGAIVFFYGGWVFLQGAFRELRAMLPGMMTLISLAISVAFLYSVAVTLGLSGHPLWWELATLDRNAVHFAGRGCAQGIGETLARCRLAHHRRRSDRRGAGGCFARR